MCPETDTTLGMQSAASLPEELLHMFTCAGMGLGAGGKESGCHIFHSNKADLDGHTMYTLSVLPVLGVTTESICHLSMFG